MMNSNGKMQQKGELSQANILDHTNNSEIYSII